MHAFAKSITWSTITIRVSTLAKMAFGFSRVFVFALAGHTLLQGLALSASACGLDWALPTNHFDGVDDHGYVAYWETVGEVDCGDGLKLPLYINFNSGRETGAPSPYLGQGWILPLLESKFVQEGEDRFVMTQPDGLRNLFLRAEANGTILNGSAGWKGEIKGNVITAWAPCGWKITFVNGRIASMQSPKNMKIEWIYDGDRLSNIRSGDTSCLRIEYNPSGRATAFVLSNGTTILVNMERKPRIQCVAGRNIVAGEDYSLSQLSGSMVGSANRFEFSMNEKLQPSLRVMDGQTLKRLISWDPMTKRIVSDGRWIYSVTANDDPQTCAQIRRTNEVGQSEYWFDDTRFGTETIGDIAGIRTVTYRFVSGMLSGRIRRIDEQRPGMSPRVLYRAYYNEAGALIREDGYQADVYAALHQSSASEHQVPLFDKLGKLIGFADHGQPSWIFQSGDIVK